MAAAKITEFTEAETLDFDLSKFKARDFRDLINAQKENDIDKIADIYAKIVVVCPSSWGDPKKAETYLDLPFLDWNIIPARMTEYIKDNSKK